MDDSPICDDDRLRPALPVHRGQIGRIIIHQNSEWRVILLEILSHSIRTLHNADHLVSGPELLNELADWRVIQHTPARGRTEEIEDLSVRGLQSNCAPLQIVKGGKTWLAAGSGFNCCRRRGPSIRRVSLEIEQVPKPEIQTHRTDQQNECHHKYEVDQLVGSGSFFKRRYIFSTLVS